MHHAHRTRIPRQSARRVAFRHGETGDFRRDKVYLALLSCASPAGEFRPLYTPVTTPAPYNGLAHPAATAGAALRGILDALVDARAFG